MGNNVRTLEDNFYVVSVIVDEDGNELIQTQVAATINEEYVISFSFKQALEVIEKLKEYAPVLGDARHPRILRNSKNESTL